VLGGIHGTFNPQVLAEAPWINAVMRGEGEQVLLNLVACIDEGRWPAERAKAKGIAHAAEGKVVANPAAAPIADTARITAGWGVLEWERYGLHPDEHPRRHLQPGAGCPFTGSFCSPWKVWRDYRVRGTEAAEAVCDHYAAAFETLLRALVSCRTRVREVACESTGAPACVFEPISPKLDKRPTPPSFPSECQEHRRWKRAGPRSRSGRG
jgi:hypothetical protein